MAHGLRFIDAAVAVAAGTALAWFGIEGGPAVRGSYAHALQFFGFIYFVAFLVIAERMHIYFARRTEDVASELLAVCEVTLYACCIAVMATEVWGGGLRPASYLQGLAAGLIALPTARMAMRFTIRRLRRGGDDYRVWLIVGRNERAARIAEAVLSNPHFGIRIDEVVDVAGSPNARNADLFSKGALASIRTCSVPNLDYVRSVLETRVIDEVVVTLPVRSCYDQIREVIGICGGAGISVKLEPEVFRGSGSATEVSHVGSIAMVTHFSGPSNYRLMMFKRIIDFVGAAGGLVLLSPLLVAIGLAVKLTSPGPMLFFQTRVGLHGRHFRMVKFRSMVRDALSIREQMAPLNERDGTAFKVKNDMRVTPLGRWLRKYHFDELPQLWNVLVGDMSLVGPRPLPVQEAFGDEWWQRRRLSMPPGLTCYWQLADDPMMPFKEWMELDMAYIDRWSIWLDLQLIVRTFATLARGRGW